MFVDMKPSCMVHLIVNEYYIFSFLLKMYNLCRVHLILLQKQDFEEKINCSGL